MYYNLQNAKPHSIHVFSCIAGTFLSHKFECANMITFCILGVHLFPNPQFQLRTEHSTLPTRGNSAYAPPPSTSMAGSRAPASGLLHPLRLGWVGKWQSPDVPHPHLALLGCSSWEGPCLPACARLGSPQAASPGSPSPGPRPSFPLHSGMR